MDIRFGKVTVDPIGAVSNCWDVTISGQEDVQAFQKLVDKYGHKENATDPAYTMTITADNYNNHHIHNRSNPLVVKINDRMPAKDELQLLSDLVDKAQPKGRRSYPSSDMFMEDMEALREGILNVAVKYIKEQAGNTKKAFQQLSSLLKQDEGYQQISRCMK